MDSQTYNNESTALLSAVHQHTDVEHQDLEEPSKKSNKKNQEVLGIAFCSFFFFTVIQTIFAIKSNSTSLLADSAAMFVDAGTYLCNLVAEKLKHRPLTEEELHLPPAALDYKVQLRRLNLELFPPMLSMFMLLSITYSAVGDSIRTLRLIGNSDDPADEEEANAGVMMFFGILFLLIDLINMFCFSKANGAMIPLSHIHLHIEYDTRAEETESVHSSTDDEDEDGSSCEGNEYDEVPSKKGHRLNLNMCSAWTHVFADTLRSVTILLAGAVSSLVQSISPDVADALAALAVSLIICISCIPLFRGIVSTAYEIRALNKLYKEATQL